MGEAVKDHLEPVYLPDNHPPLSSWVLSHHRRQRGYLLVNPATKHAHHPVNILNEIMARGWSPSDMGGLRHSAADPREPGFEVRV